jgi:signal transduction histidine kinase
MLDLFLIIDGFILFALGLLAILALSSDYKLGINRLFAAFAIFIGVWTITNHITNDLDVPGDVVLIGNYFVFASSFGAMILMLKIITQMVNDTQARRVTKLVEPLLWITFAVSATPLTVAGVERQELTWGINFGPMIPIWALCLLIAIMVTYYNIFRGYKTLKGLALRRLKSMTLSISVALPLTVIIAFILPVTTGMFWMTEFGIAPMVILVAGLYYSVVKHSLFDIRLAAVRTTAYALSLLALAVLYYAAAYLISTLVFKERASNTFSVSPLNIVLALVLAFIFQPIKNFFDRITNNIFYRDRYSTSEFYSRLNEVLSSTTDLRNLLTRAATELGSTLKSEQAFFYVQYNHVHHVSAGTPRHTNLPVRDAHHLNEHVAKNDDSVIVADLLPDNDPVHRLLISHRIAVLMPLTRKNTILGYLALGEQRSGGYTNRDIKVLRTVSDELVIAIQNALSVQEVKDINAHLEQRIHAATKELQTSNAKLRHLDTTKDEFLSMASHQLRTPLTSVKGYLSMVLEGDAGEVNDMQKHLLGEAFSSSERMVHLIHDFLNVSRLQTGKFMLEQSPVDLVKLVQSEVQSLESVASARNIKLKFWHTGDIPLLNIDENKIQQVVMNYIDNALFYSRDTSQPVQISVERVEDMIDVKVVDTGIGVPKSEQAQLFSKFYRASNARKQRPDGTGVGIYLAKKVVTAHGGDIIFESEEGKGSTFGFRLPLDKLAVESDGQSNNLVD